MFLYLLYVRREKLSYYTMSLKIRRFLFLENFTVWTVLVFVANPSIIFETQIRFLLQRTRYVSLGRSSCTFGGRRYHVSMIDVAVLDARKKFARTVRISATSCQFTFCPYHHSGGDGYTSTAVCVGHDVAETDAQERDGDEPHGVEEICMLLIVEPVVGKTTGALL